MIQLIIYLILLISVGINFMLLLNKLKIFEIKRLQKEEIVAFVLTSGIILFTVYMYVIGLIGIPYERYIFIPVIIGFIFNVIYGCYFLVNKIRKKEFENKEKPIVEMDKKTIIRKGITVILLVANISYILFFISLGMKDTILNPDEFSAWALNAKNIFIGKRMDFFINTGLENYPNGLPLLYSGLYVLIGNIQENLIRGFAGIFVFINLLNMISFCKRRNVNKNIPLILLLFVYNYFSRFQSYATSAYGDLAALTLYTGGLLYFIEWLVYDRKNESMIISILNTAGACWCKQDSLFVINIVILIIFAIFNKKIDVPKVRVKDIFIYGILVAILPISWKVYNIVAGFPTELAAGAGASFEVHFEYVVSLMQNITTKFYEDKVTVILLGIILAGMFITFHKLDKKDKLCTKMLIIHIISYVIILIITYIIAFAEEALIAASFIRYYARVIMVQVVTASILINPLLKEESVQTNKES